MTAHEGDTVTDTTTEADTTAPQAIEPEPTQVSTYATKSRDFAWGVDLTGTTLGTQWHPLSTAPDWGTDEADYHLARLGWRRTTPWVDDKDLNGKGYGWRAVVVQVASPV